MSEESGIAARMTSAIASGVAGYSAPATIVFGTMIDARIGRKSIRAIASQAAA